METVGMYGDLQSNAGNSIQEIEGLDTTELYSIINSDEANAQ